MGSAAAFDGAPAPNEVVTPESLTPTEALRYGARQYYSGDKEAALTSLQYAAKNGQPMAAWKLGRMYASGDGVQEDDLKAFEYYRQVVREHGDGSPTAPNAPFVSSAFVALGSYYLTGIGSAIKPNTARARQIFTHAASYFGDPSAQYELGRMYQNKNDRLAVRWYNLAAIKGHIGAQARLGETLFNLGESEGRKVRGLMWLTVARAQMTSADGEWIGEMQERYFALADEHIRRQASVLADAWLDQNARAVTAAQ